MLRTAAALSVAVRLTHSRSVSLASRIIHSCPPQIISSNRYFSDVSKIGSIINTKFFVEALQPQTRHISVSCCSFAEKDELASEEAEVSILEEQKEAGIEPSAPGAIELARKSDDKDRSKVIHVDTSIRYLKSEAYKQTYGDNAVWVLYRRNFKGQFAPKRTRRTCIRKDVLTTGNPCPICRDEYLVLDYRNVDLLKQFISPYNGEILSYTKTGLCQKRHSELLVAILKARDYGTITFDVPVREYDYSEYEHLYKSYREL